MVIGSVDFIFGCMFSAHMEFSLFFLASVLSLFCCRSKKVQARGMGGDTLGIREVHSVTAYLCIQQRTHQSGVWTVSSVCERVD